MTNANPAALEAVLSISELAADLGVSVQAIYDLRSQGRGPRGFRVGRASMAHPRGTSDRDRDLDRADL